MTIRNKVTIHGLPVIEMIGSRRIPLKTEVLETRAETLLIRSAHMGRSNEKKHEIFAVGGVLQGFAIQCFYKRCKAAFFVKALCHVYQNNAWKPIQRKDGCD